MAKKIARQPAVPAGKPASGSTDKSASGGGARIVSNENAKPRESAKPREIAKPRETVKTTPRRQSAKRSALPWQGIALGAGAILLLGVLAWVAAGGFYNLNERIVPDEGRGHVAPGTALSFRTNPPASGTHYSTTTTWAVHKEPVETGYWVHNLEHGGIVLLYKCPDNNCPDTVSQIESLHGQMPRSKYNTIKLAAVPFNEMTPNFMVSAWNAQLDLDTLDQEKITAFYNKYVDKGPEDVP
jgi:hypothetical protein